MAELSFDVALEWSGSGREGGGTIVTDDLEIEYSGPEAMGGRGVGSNPEELLVSAVGACFSSTLAGFLHRSSLPAIVVRVAASGAVSGYPLHTRFARLTVSPTIVGGDPSRAGEYEEAAGKAHARCFIGHTLGSGVDYRLGPVTVVPAPVAA